MDRAKRRPNNEGRLYWSARQVRACRGWALFCLFGQPYRGLALSRIRWQSPEGAKTEFVEHPSAMSTRKGRFSNALSVIYIPWQKLRLKHFHKLHSARFLQNVCARRFTAGIVPLPERAMPSASVRQFMEFAVNIPAHEPQPGQAEFSMSQTYSSSAFPAAYLPKASNTSFKFVAFPALSRPGIIGPPAAEYGRPVNPRRSHQHARETILSQFGNERHSVESMRFLSWSRRCRPQARGKASEKFMPECPIAMPSHTPIVFMRTGVPPAIRIPSATAFAILSRWMWPGTISLPAWMTPTRRAG